MQPVMIPDPLMQRIVKGTVIAKNVGSPPAVSMRVLLDKHIHSVEVCAMPDFSEAAFIAVALSNDLTFIDLVWIDKDELGKGGLDP